MQFLRSLAFYVLFIGWTKTINHRGAGTIISRHNFGGSESQVLYR
jgi:hypothetical protein